MHPRDGSNSASSFYKGPTPSTSSHPSTSSADSFNVNKPKRTLAKRCCLKCREKKTRCELPDLFVPSSQQPLVESKRCHRCKVLYIDCVVWDSDRKRKPNLSMHQPPAKRDPNNFQHLDELADVALAHRPREGDIPLNNLFRNSQCNPDASRASSSSSSSPPVEEPFFNPSPQHFGVEPSASSSYSNTPNVAQPSGITPPDQSGSFFSRQGGMTNQSPADGEDASDYGVIRPFVQGAMEDIVGTGWKVDKLDPRSNLSIGESIRCRQGRTWRSMWRPLNGLVEYAAKQPKFTSYVADRVVLPPSLRFVDVFDLIDESTLARMEQVLIPYFVWHPHLPMLRDLHSQAHDNSPVNRPKQLLLATMYLISARHFHSPKSELVRGLSALIDRLGTQLLLSSTREFSLVQALELLLAHEPSLIGTSACGGREEQAKRGLSLSGDSILTTASSIARDLGLDFSIDELVRTLSLPREQRSSARLAELYAACSIWNSLKMWEGHSLFARSPTRTVDELTPLVAKSNCMIAVDEYGDKLKSTPPTLEMLTSTTMVPPTLQDVELLRSAGRSVLVYRLQGMARFQVALCNLLDAMKGTEADSLSRLTEEERSTTIIHLRKRLSEIVIDALEDFHQMQSAIHVGMAPFALMSTAISVEKWSRLEGLSLFSLLSTFGITCMYAGHLETEFSAKNFIEVLSRDQGLRNCVASVGQYRMDFAKQLIPRFITLQSQNRSNGAPAFLTCALVVDSCKLFLESTAFVLMSFGHLDNEVDVKLVLLGHAAEKLQGMETTFPDDDGTMGIGNISADYVRIMASQVQKWQLASSIFRAPVVPMLKKRTDKDLDGAWRGMMPSTDNLPPAKPAPDSLPYAPFPQPQEEPQQLAAHFWQSIVDPQCSRPMQHGGMYELPLFDSIFENLFANTG